MSARPYATGPCFLYVGVGDVTTTRDIPAGTAGNSFSTTETTRSVGNAPVFLGTCEHWPVILIKPEFKPLFTDFGGMVPEDVAFAGEHAFIVADVNDFSEAAYRSIAARPFYWAIRGRAYTSGVGTLMLREGQAYPLWIVFPYAVKAVFNPTRTGLLAVSFIPVVSVLAGGILAAPTPADAMPAGYRFPASLLEGPDRLDPLGTKARKINLVWHALPETRTKKRVLYDHDMSAVKSVKPQIAGIGR